MNARLLLIHALAPVHCGTGQAIGGIDLPIARERPTGIPLVPGSSLKGVLRAAAPIDADTHRIVFGPETENAADNAGSVQFSDANLVFLPVRSVRGTFAWVTSPYILMRLARDAREAGRKLEALPEAPVEASAKVTGPVLQADGRVVFEDYDFKAEVDPKFEALAKTFATWLFGSEPAAEAGRKHFVARACLVSDDVMSLLLQTCTEITARIRLEADSKTVAKGHLWSEEALPVESILAGLVVATPVKQKKDGTTPDPARLLDYVKQLTARGAMQLGGKATVGRGVCRVRLEG